MRLLTYNIHKGVGGTDRRYRLERIIEVIAAEAPDLICLQEVDRNVRRSLYHDQPALLAHHLDAAAHIYQLNVPHQEGGYGNLLMSRWHFRCHHHLCLRMGRRKPRGAQLAVVETPHGPLHLVNWHLGLRDKERRWQAERLLCHETFQSSAHLPTLVAGDSNDWLNALDGHAFARHQFRQVTQPASCFRTFPAFFSLMTLDKVFYRGEVAIRDARVVRTPLTRRASDHLPLVVDFDLTPPVPVPQAAIS
jgi:endonuclease/exonuclease/phosphatase family metal-dependent hydrolase